MPRKPDFWDGHFRAQQCRQKHFYQYSIREKSCQKLSNAWKNPLSEFFSTTWEDKENALMTTFNAIDLPGFGYAKVSKSLKKNGRGFYGNCWALGLQSSFLSI